MYAGRLIFSQVMDFLPMHEFRKCVQRYGGNYKVQSFSCFDQFLCMAFGRLTYRNSLRDTVTCLRALQPKLYHVGIRGKVTKRTLADANKQRDWRIYRDFAHVLTRAMPTTQKKSTTDGHWWTQIKNGDIFCRYPCLSVFIRGKKSLMMFSCFL